jgi:UDP:flavonoid glycosyltransferase YjiC (YdhE family)
VRVLFTPWAWSPHYFPLVPLAWALRNAGHEVRVATAPSLVDVVTDSGLPAVAVGSDVDFVPLVGEHMDVEPDVEMNAARWERLRSLKGPRALEMFVRLAESVADDLIDFTRAWPPDLVVHTPSAFIGPLAAAAAGVPNVRHLKGPDIASGIAPLAARLMRPLCDRHGVGQISPLGTATIDICPPALRVTADYPRIDMRYVPYNGPGLVPDWLLDQPSRRRVCVTWGTTVGRLNPHLMLSGRVIEAIAELDIEIVVAATPDAIAGLGELPGNVRLAESMPLSLLLPSCSAIINQGGVGTCMTAAALGVPQLVIPQFPDHMFTASALERGGCGLTLLPEDATPDGIRAHLGRLLDDDALRAGTARIAAQVTAMPSPADIVADLEALAGASGPARLAAAR